MKMPERVYPSEMKSLMSREEYKLYCRNPLLWQKLQDKLEEEEEAPKDGVK